jgi:hypothetical protein
LSGFTFAPLPTQDGFKITGTLTNAPTGTTFSEMEIDWNFVNFSTISGQKTVVGVTVTTVATTNTTGTHLLFDQFEQADITDPTNFVLAQVGGIGATGSCGLTSSCAVDFPRGPVAGTNSAGQLVALGSDAGSGGSVTSTETDFIVRELATPPPPVTSIPEPAEWSLMVLGLGLLGLTSRRRSTRAT